MPVTSMLYKCGSPVLVRASRERQGKGTEPPPAPTNPTGNRDHGFSLCIRPLNVLHLDGTRPAEMLAYVKRDTLTALHLAVLGVEGARICRDRYGHHER